MHGRRLTLIVCLLLSMAGLGKAQTIDSLLDQYDAKVPQEKLYVHFDNTVYVPGQTVWYKAYLFKGRELSDISKNFYLNWFDEKGKIIGRVVAPVIGSTAAGSFTVPENYTGSRLQVLAYTKWMLNFDSAFLFHKIIPVSQPTMVKNNETGVVPVTSLRFFPEGGDMVEGLTSVIAFKAVNTAGLPVQVNGIITNRKMQTVTEFTSLHDGMGAIKLTPEPGEQYTAEWKDAWGVTQYTNLPAAKSTGIVLTVNNQSAIPLFSINRQSVSEDRFKKLSIVATINQQLMYRAVANLSEKPTLNASLPSSNFTSGILRLTVFDANRQPVAERILFLNNNEYQLVAEVNFDTVNLGRQGRNLYNIVLPDSVLASLSISITDGESVYDSSQNIISQLLLSSEIRGKIHNPAFYFSSEEDSVSHYLDLVMLTNGWRRFAWDDVMNTTTPLLKYERDTSYVSIAGKIDKLNESKIKKAESVNLILMAKDSSKQFIFTSLRPDGSFSEDNLLLFDTTKLFYQLNKTNIPVRSNITIRNSFLPFDTAKRVRILELFVPDTTGLGRLNAIAAEQKRIEELIKQATLKEVVVHAKVKSRLEEMHERYASGFFQSWDAYQFNVADDRLAHSLPSAFEYLLSKVAGLKIDNAYSPSPRASWRGSPVALFLNEFPVNASVLSSVSMSNVAYIQVFRPPFIGAIGGGAGGAIAVYTRKGEDSKSVVIGLDFTLIPGYTPVKEFYSPNYAEQQQNFPQKDLRRTVYWKPNILSDGVNKKITVSFYNNDISHTLQLVIEGVSQDGKLIHVSRLLKQ